MGSLLILCSDFSATSSRGGIAAHPTVSAEFNLVDKWWAKSSPVCLLHDFDSITIIRYSKEALGTGRDYEREEDR
jgi:hypothetical protein